MSSTSTYRQIIKTTSLFGGVEIVRILSGLVQTKIVALLLGPAGVGVQNLYTTVLNMLSSFWGFGLQTSSVREIAQANATGDSVEISKTIVTLRRWVLSTALLGAFFLIIFSRQLSKWTFGDDSYAFGLVLVSLALIFSLISNGQIALIKGLRRLKDLAKASMLGSLISLIISIPLFYLYGEKAIVPSIVITALLVLLCSYYYARKIIVEPCSLSFKESFIRGKTMFKMGFFLMLSSFLMNLSSFLINSFISNYGSIDDVGYYRAGFLITSHYVGLIFTAMGADFLPRLSEVNKNPGQMREIVLQQTEIASLIIAPMVTFLFPLNKLMIYLLYSDDFYIIEDFICWAALGLVARAGVWCLSYLMLANGLSKEFFYSELFANVTNVILCVVCYHFWGIAGLGIAFLINNLLSLLFNYLITRIYCNFWYGKQYILKMTVLNITVCLSLCLYAMIHSSILSIVVALLFTLYCVNEIRKKTGLKLASLLKMKKNKPNTSSNM